MWQCPKCKREFKNTNQNHFCETPTSIDAYILEQPEAIRPILVRVRDTIRAAAPDAVEKISWQMPTFWQGENLIHFAASKKHLGLYPGDLSLAPFAERLEGRCTPKGAIHFPYDEPIDYDLIAEITKYRVEAAAQHRIEKKSKKD